jgi:hypothetical protein
MRLKTPVLLLLCSLSVNLTPIAWAACPCAQRSTLPLTTSSVQSKSVLANDSVEDYRILLVSAINVMLTYLKTLEEAVNQTENLSDSFKTNLLVTIERESVFLELKLKQAAQIENMIQINNSTLEIIDHWVAVGWDLRMTAAQVLIARVDKILEGFTDIVAELETQVDPASPQAEALRETKQNIEEARELRDQSLTLLERVVPSEDPRELARLFAESKQIYSELINALRKIHLKLSSIVQSVP